MSKLFYTPRMVRVNSIGEPYPNARANFYLTQSTTQTNVYEDSELATPLPNPVIAGADGQFPPIYLDPSITYRMVLTDENSVVLDDVDPAYVPVGAGDILVDDPGNYFDGETVEEVLQDIGTNYANKTRDETITGDWTFSGAKLFMQDNELLRPEITDYAITTSTETVGPTTNINFEEANVQNITLDQNTTINLQNPPQVTRYGQMVLLIQQGAGAYTVSWQQTVRWPGGTAPTISAGNGAIDVITLFTVDGGVTYYGTYAQAYS